jgi:hypothetical protein
MVFDIALAELVCRVKVGRKFSAGRRPAKEALNPTSQLPSGSSLSSAEPKEHSGHRGAMV